MVQTLHTTTFARNEAAPAAARAVLDDHADAIGTRALPMTQLLVSELVTNSVRHGRGSEVRLVVEAVDGRVRCEVVDDGDGFTPVLRDRAPDAPGGWGLHLVETLAERWGVRDGSTHVWFELSA